MRQFKRICVYCGSSAGVDQAYLEMARAAGDHLARRGIAVVFGGGRVGMMGAVADGALAAGGQVIGVIPEKLRGRELAHTGLTELFVVDSMHARKTMMAYLSDGFIALPGGFGTLEEIFEVTTWSQLNYHMKPVGLLNMRGYFDKLIAFLDHAAVEGFVRSVHRPLMQSSPSIDTLLHQMATVEIPEMGRWIEKP
ncbi:MAG: TIGR00730 family Rossman fold protein [Polyangiaceae bacterium]|nr:TIGR00730 family Rossman fold protein [Polyangiaceae bacterium]